MRKIILYILPFFLSAHVAYASVNSAVVMIHRLNDSQKTILYQYAILKHFATNVQAEAYWQQNKQHFSPLSEQLKLQLVTEIYEHVQLDYKPVNNVSVRMWLHAQSLTNWLLYIAMLIGIIALVRIIYTYWYKARAWLVRWLYPVFRYLFSPLALTCELLAAGLLLVYFGVAIQDMFMRTVLIHVGIFISWAQLTALLYKEYFFREYIKGVIDSVVQSYKEGFAKPFLPALLATLLYVYVIWKLPGDGWYYFEIVIAALLSLYALPFVRKLEPKLSFILLPFSNLVSDRNKRVMHYTIIFLFLSVAALVWLPSFLFPSATGMACIYIIFLLLSSLWANKQGLRNYIYQQVFCFVCIGCLLIVSYHQQWLDLLYLNLVAFIAFIIIRYWEVPVILGTRWTKKTIWWGLLGQAFILWLIAQGIQDLMRQLSL